MILPNPKDAIHRGQLFKILMEIADSPMLAKNLVFKGGTCAAMQGLLDRFSVNLDFDLVSGADKENVKVELKTIFPKLGLIVKNQSKTTIQYVLKYPAPENSRNTLKLDTVDESLAVGIYQPIYLSDIDRYLLCQTIETMFAHKLVAVLDRYSKHHSVAGRDIYDIYYFFLNQHTYSPTIIQTRTRLGLDAFFGELIDFIQNKVTESIINEDLNMLLPPQQFSAIRKSLKAEVLAMLRSELTRHAGFPPSHSGLDTESQKAMGQENKNISH